MTACTSEVEVHIQICDLMTNIWTMPIKIRHGANPFAWGGLRNAYFVVCSDSQGLFNLNDPMVLKIPKDPYISLMDEASGRAQAMMQASCQRYANNYNSMGVPKHVNFLTSQLVKFLDGIWAGRYATIEKYIGGTYIKHNIANPGNAEFALTLRNTPQAFTHFTYEYSRRSEIVVDIQGVGDYYTDPQIFSVSRSYGLSDFGKEGIDHFCQNHECNAICKSLGLKQIENGVFFTPRTTANGLGTMPLNPSSFQLAPITTNMGVMPTNANPYRNAPMWNMALFLSPYPPAPMFNGIGFMSLYPSPYPMA